MKRVTGLGGVFIKCHDQEKMINWYKNHLGIDIQSWGGVAFTWENAEEGNEAAYSVFSFFKSDNEYFAPSQSNFMINLRVHDLDALVEVLKNEGVELAGKPYSDDFGKFAWVIDPEGNKVELWEQPI